VSLSWYLKLPGQYRLALVRSEAFLLPWKPFMDSQKMCLPAFHTLSTCVNLIA
jgi:hypothetical protein